MKLRTKIVLTYIALAVVGIGIASMISSWQLKSFLNHRTETQLTGQVEFLADLIVTRHVVVDSTGSDESFLGGFSRKLGLRLTLIRKDGVVMYDSDVPKDSLHLLENHANRPEVVRARMERIGTDRRLSVSVKQEFLYAARRVYDASAGPLDSGYVRGALNITEIVILDNQVQAIIWIVGLATIVLIVIASVMLSNRITSPILRIASTAKAIKDGDFRQRIDITSRDEIGELGQAINEMAEKLGNDSNQLRKLERVRSEFLANVSHELRTPIFSIQGFLETLLDGAVDDPSVNREFLEKAHKHATRLNALLNDLIDISRIESGEMKMSFRYFPVQEFLQQIVEEMRPGAEKKGLTLSLVSSIAPDARAYGDRDRLRQVVVNLLDNAIKYTDSGGAISCSVEGRGDACVISVSDSGSGIAPEHHSRIFERFYRVDKDRSRDVGGTGLGLAIVKHIVEAHGGSIRVISAVGKGSVFTFTLKR
jgi:two-component system, OmpR family, phosphate regulon sensor histidine kinase PhoR